MSGTKDPAAPRMKGSKQSITEPNPEITSIGPAASKTDRPVAKLQDYFDIVVLQATADKVSSEIFVYLSPESGCGVNSLIPWPT